MPPMWVVQVHRWQIATAFIVLALSYVGALIWIQDGRLQSCVRTYEGVREVFEPFLPPPGKATPKQQRDVDKFNARVELLKKQCGNQIKLWWP